MKLLTITAVTLVFTGLLLAFVRFSNLAQTPTTFDHSLFCRQATLDWLSPGGLSPLGLQENPKWLIWIPVVQTRDEKLFALKTFQNFRKDPLESDLDGSQSSFPQSSCDFRKLVC